MNNISSNTRFIFITGGVVSSLGKGLAAASIGALLQARNFKICIRKLDPYLNIDPGTMSPIQHGEVFVTADGTESDLDLGHYERFTGVETTKNDSITSGKIYNTLLKKERRGDYLGQTVQVIPHVTEIIKSFIFYNMESIDFVICEIGGTVGDIEIQPFLEAIRQMNYQLSKSHTIFVHLTLVPYISVAQELKTKPTQHSVKELNSIGIQPDILLCRSEKMLSQEHCDKIASFCNLLPANVIPAIDVENIYDLPVIYHEYALDDRILKHFNLNSISPNLVLWNNISKARESIRDYVCIAIIGKYTKLLDAYKSLTEALYHAALYNRVKIDIKWIDSRLIDSNTIEGSLFDVSAILIPGGFGKDGINGKILAANYARVNKIPFLGICMGMQVAVIEFSSNVAMLEDANSTEFNNDCKNPVVKLIKEFSGIHNCDEKEDELGGSMRLGVYSCCLNDGSKIADIYQSNIIEERRRHRYGIDVKYQEVLEQKGLIFSGKSESENLLEVIELNNHPWFIGTQFHPEFKSNPFNAHPLFISFIHAAIEKRKMSINIRN